MSLENSSQVRLSADEGNWCSSNLSSLVPCLVKPEFLAIGEKHSTNVGAVDLSKIQIEFYVFNALDLKVEVLSGLN